MKHAMGYIQPLVLLSAVSTPEKAGRQVNHGTTYGGLGMPGTTSWHARETNISRS